MTHPEAIRFITVNAYAGIDTFELKARVCTAREVAPEVEWRRAVMDAADVERSDGTDHNAVQTLEHHLAQEMLRWPS